MFASSPVPWSRMVGRLASRYHLLSPAGKRNAPVSRLTPAPKQKGTVADHTA